MDFLRANEDRLKHILIGIIFASLLVHVSSVILSHTVFKTWRWVHLPFHSAMEMAGSLIALIVAYLLITLEKREEGTSFNVRIAAALIGMGILDGFHAVVTVGESFVWLHSSSTLVGGCLFGLVWLPLSKFKRVNSNWPLLTLVLVLFYGGISLSFPEFIPPMVNSANFTSIAIAMNLIGGFLLLGSSLKLFLTYRQNKQTDDLLFSVHCLLFGSAALMFNASALWDFSWWAWHFLRLMAYGAGLIFAVNTNLRDQIALRNRKQTLEDRVADRTEQLEDALEEKKTLLKEIHHRVKNNLQTILSLLNLQLHQINDENQRRGFEDIKDRIKSIALVHELLYQSEDLTSFDFENYTQRLCSQLMNLARTGTDITVTTQIEITEVDVDTGLSCGLILNELITNSLQHAFNEQPEGTISLSFWAENGQYHLIVEDDGMGIPDNSTPPQEDSLGLELVRTIVRTDLKGELKTETDNGTKITITFPKPQ
jgi:two-component sensor histidine kinase